MTSPTRPCDERAGFLLDSGCLNPVEGECGLCAKAVCALHWHTLGPDRLCTSCTREAIRKDLGKRRYGAFEVAEEISLATVEYTQLKHLTGVRFMHQVMQSTPRTFQLLEFLVMHDCR